MEVQVMKTKLGVSAGVLAAATYFMGLFGGFTVLVVLVGYVLLFEQDSWLRKSAVKAFALAVIFSIIYAVIGFIPDLMGMVDDVFGIFGGDFNINFINYIVYFLQDAVNVLEKIVFLILGLMAFRQNTIHMGSIDKLVD